MNFFSTIVHFFLIITTPALIALSKAPLPTFIVQKVSHSPLRIPDLHTLSYDDIALACG